MAISTSSSATTALIKKLLYFNDGKGRFSVAGTWGVPEWSTRNAAIADMNGDGRPDVIAANRPGPSYACLNDGHGKLVEPMHPDTGRISDDDRASRF